MVSFRSIAVIALLSTGLMTAACVSTRTQQAPGEYVDDSVLTTKVKAALFDDPVTKARQINVETYRGVVQLSGFVDSSEEKSVATKVARSVGGVQEVRNDLELKQR
jgi:osmotically-inducible protein OsmY